MAGQTMRRRPGIFTPVKYAAQEPGSRDQDHRDAPILCADRSDVVPIVSTMQVERTKMDAGERASARSRAVSGVLTPEDDIALRQAGKSSRSGAVVREAGGVQRESCSECSPPDVDDTASHLSCHR